MQEHLRRRLALPLFGLALALGCGKSSSDGARPDGTSSRANAKASPGADGELPSIDSIGALIAGLKDASDADSNTDSLGFVRIARGPDRDSLGMLADVAGLTLARDCPEPGPTAAAEMAAQAAARIPLKVGLTLSHTWKAFANDYEHECLEQVTAVDLRGIDVSESCPVGADRRRTHTTRRLCRADLASSTFYIAETGPDFPNSLRGSLQFSLSAASFAALGGAGKVRHHFLDVQNRKDTLLVLDHDIDGVLESEGKSTYKIAINDAVVEVPTVEATLHDAHELIRVKVLDDASVPIMLDYYMPGHHFFITYTKVSFPTEHGLEQRLATDRKVDVYGIYFDFASDSLREESTPVLKEIGAALAAHPDWKLAIAGHTDSIGGAASNLELSRRRSARVRRALVEQYGVDGARLTTTGYGSGSPKDVNTTDEGRARNRRVELVRY